jgi:hypothetical protein
LFPSLVPDPPVLDQQELLEALRAEQAERLEVFGYLGRRDDTHCAFLARERATDRLVVVNMRAAAGADGDLTIEATTQTTLDASVPDAGALCSGCRTQLRPWARFCHHCGTDVSGLAASSGLRHNRDALLAAVRDRAAEEGKYEILGDMTRSEGGGLVYFARERETDRLVAFRLDRQPDEGYAMQMTRVIKPPRPTARPTPRTGRISISMRTRAEEVRAARSAIEAADTTERAGRQPPVAPAAPHARSVQPPPAALPPVAPPPRAPASVAPEAPSWRPEAPSPPAVGLPPSAPWEPTRRGALVAGGVGVVLLLLLLAALL